MIITSRAPVRIDFAGAWTDVSYFADAFGGATLNAAIRMHVSGSLEANEEETNSAFLSQMVSGPSGKYVPSSQTALRVNYESTIPPGSGLGTSATLNVVWLALVRREPISSLADKLHIAELAYDIEKTLGIIGGKQDQYASAVGGINLFEFREEGVTQQALELTPDQLTELSSLLVLCYTGKQRLSSNIHRNVWSNFRAGKENTLRALFDLRNSAYEAREALEDWDLEAFARIVSSQRHYMKNLDASTTNDQIEGLFEAVSADIMGGKPCGAGGGGCVFFIARSLKARDRILNTLKDQGLAGLDVVFDTEGLVLERDS
jgi:D-glycero-alpha-D-manno-heptose-7-phosphate kinase